MYRTTVDGKETYLIVMKSVFGTKLKIHKKYDLKGSTIDRQASDKEKVLSNLKVLSSTNIIVCSTIMYSYFDLTLSVLNRPFNIMLNSPKLSL